MNTEVTLTRLELNIVQELSDGYEYKEIAARKNRSFFTIENQIRKIKEKTGTKNVAHLISWYFITRYKILVSFFLVSITFANLLFDDPTARCRRVRQTQSRTTQRKECEWQPIYLTGFDIE